MVGSSVVCLICVSFVTAPSESTCVDGQEQLLEAQWREEERRKDGKKKEENKTENRKENRE